jgi:nucleotide-binding universal stress UspA family protein
MDRSPFAQILCPMGLVNRDDPQASETSIRALRTAGGMAAGDRKAAVVSLYVVPTFVMHMTGFREEDDPEVPGATRWVPIASAGFERQRPDEIARARVSEYARANLPRGVRWEVAVRIGDPSEEILAAASEMGADVILMPARRTTDGPATGGPLGRVTYRVARTADCSVLVLR